MKRVLALAFALLLAALPACGGGGDGGAAGTIVAGPATLALPVLPEAVGEAVTVGLRNLTTSAATVHVTARSPGGAAYPAGTVPVDLPPRGAARLPLATFTGAALTIGGWLEVETRDVATLDPVTGEPTSVETTGFVAAYAQRAQAGRETDGALAAAFRSDLVWVDLNPQSQAFQLVSRSFVPAPGGATATAVDVDVRVYDAFGGLVTTIPVLVPANGSVLFAPPVLTGHVQASPTLPPAQSAPAGTEFRLAIAAVEADPQVLIEARLADVPRDLGQRDVGFPLQFGRDFTGNAFDFEVVITNPTGDDATVLLRQVRRADGSAILSAPRSIGLDARHTKVLATTTTLSAGLDVGELSPFADLFGDVGLAANGDLDVFWLDWAVPEEVEISARAVDTLFKSAYRILPGRKLTTDAMVLGVEVPSSLGSGVRNYVTLVNPTTAALTVNVRAFTPGGTEYVLPSATVFALGRLDWSPDGQIWREDPSDTTGPAVPFLAFRFTTSGGMHVDARRERRDAQGYVLGIVPHPVRDLRAD